MHWIIAIDTKGHCRSSMELAKWLRHQSAIHHFYGLHVPEADDDPELSSRDHARAVIRSARAETLFEDMIETKEEGSSPAAVLAGVPQGLASGLIVSRHADAKGSELIRLGTVVRQVVEHADLPVVVVPRDLEAENIGPGPVMAAVDPEITSREVAQASHVLAAAVDRGLDLGHVWVHGERGVESVGEGKARALVALEAWAHDRQIAVEARIHVDAGEFRFGVIELARRHEACLLVCGTRQRAWTSRLLEPSRALELARYAPMPVMIVPRSDAARDS